MAQKAFGRRQSVLSAGAERPAASEASSAGSDGLSEALADADAPSRSAMRSVMIVGAVGSVIVVMALGAAYGLNAAVSSNDGTVEAKQECRGQPNCINQYDVALTCDDSTEPKSVSIMARDADAAERKAERYNRNCRTRRVTFVTSMIRSAVRTTFGGYRYEEPSARYASRRTTTRRMGRFRLRFRFR
jgi:hypothetical protein